MNERSNTTGRGVLVALAVVFMVPIAVAWWFNLRPETATLGASNRGALIAGAPTLGEGGLSPLTPIAPSAVTPSAASFSGDGHFLGKWTLLSVSLESRCAQSCAKSLYITRQVRWALGRDIDRVQRVLVHAADDNGPVSVTPTREDGLSELLATRAWRERLATTLAQPDAIASRIFVVDPRGRLVLFYSTDADPSGLIKDMKRLLRFSKIG